MPAISVEDFKAHLRANRGMILVKFSATWCVPCQRIAVQVRDWFNRFPSDQVQTLYVDIDESIELYSFLKSKKMIKGVPAILMYVTGNTSYVFDDAVNTSDAQEVERFFRRCVLALGEMRA